VYNGHWQNSKMHGDGHLMWKDGSKSYSGQFVNDLRNGYGEYSWQQGQKFYRGQWKDGKQHGVGFIRESTDQVERKSIWVEGKLVKWIEEDQTESLEYVNRDDDRNWNSSRDTGYQLRQSLSRENPEDGPYGSNFIAEIQQHGPKLEQKMDDTEETKCSKIDQMSEQTTLSQAKVAKTKKIQVNEKTGTKSTTEKYSAHLRLKSKIQQAKAARAPKEQIKERSIESKSSFREGSLVDPFHDHEYA
jgi:hypothetical protein